MLRRHVDERLQTGIDRLQFGHDRPVGQLRERVGGQLSTLESIQRRAVGRGGALFGVDDTRQLAPRSRRNSRASVTSI